MGTMVFSPGRFMSATFLCLLLVEAEAFMPSTTHSLSGVQRLFNNPIIYMSHHPQKKATKKHAANRPKKHRPSDINRKPPPYDVAPLLNPDLPPCYTVVDEFDSSYRELVLQEKDPSEEVDIVQYMIAGRKEFELVRAD